MDLRIELEDLTRPAVHELQVDAEAFKALVCAAVVLNASVAKPMAASEVRRARGR